MADFTDLSCVLVRWEPPPKESQNGVITGYKIKWRRAGKGTTQTVSTDGSRRLYAVTGKAVTSGAGNHADGFYRRK
jgi:hypothetical protein